MVLKFDMLRSTKALMVVLLLKASWRESAAVSNFDSSAMKMERHPISVILCRLLQSSNSWISLFPFRAEDSFDYCGSQDLLAWSVDSEAMMILRCIPPFQSEA
jgi:hypothetical protein